MADGSGKPVRASPAAIDGHRSPMNEISSSSTTPPPPHLNTPPPEPEPRTFEQFAEYLQSEPRYHPLLRQALTHRSQSELAPHGDNERLEFLGDSILGMLVNEYLYLAYPSATEGELTRMKANLVSEPSLAEAARGLGLGLGPLLDIARGEEVGGGRDRPSILSDAFEAVLAAVYLARGIDAARAFVHQHLITATDPLLERDHKSV